MFAPRFAPCYFSIMATVKLYLKNPSAETSAIRAVISDGRGYQQKVYPGVSVKTKNWSKVKHCVHSSDADAVAINTFLRNFKRDLKAIYLKAKSKGVNPTLDYLKKEVFKKDVEELTFWKVWDLFVQSKSDEPQSLLKFRALRKHLEAFEEFCKKPLDFETISKAKLEDFQKFCYSHRNHNTQTVSKYIGFFKTFLNWSVERKYSENIDFKYFKAIRQPDTLKVIITDHELQQIEKLNLSPGSYLYNARELLILSCHTGLRYSDYSRVNKHHLKSEESGKFSLQIRQQKTDEDLDLPLTPRTAQIVKGLIDGSVRPISNQKMNKYVKEVCKLAGVDEPFEVFSYVGKKKTKEVKPKFSLVSTHTGRRTFATKLLERFPAEVVMMYTGHKDYSSFAKYVNIPKNAHKEAIRDVLTGVPDMRIAQ